MKFLTFPVKTHRGCPVYVRCFGNHFEYLTVIGNQIYQHVVKIKPRLLRGIFWKLGMLPHPFSQGELSSNRAYLEKMCYTTIETLTK